MACRQTISVLVKCGRWNEFVAALKNFAHFEKERQGPAMRFFAPQSGQGGRIVIEIEYDSLADMERHMDSIRFDKRHTELREKVYVNTVDGQQERSIAIEISPFSEFY